jgi:hypothetical protein
MRYNEDNEGTEKRPAPMCFRHEINICYPEGRNRMGPWHRRGTIARPESAWPGDGRPVGDNPAVAAAGAEGGCPRVPDRAALIGVVQHTKDREGHDVARIGLRRS